MPNTKEAADDGRPCEAETEASPSSLGLLLHCCISLSVLIFPLSLKELGFGVYLFFFLAEGEKLPVPGEGFVLGRLGRQMERYRTRVAWGKLLSQCSQVGVFFFFSLDVLVSGFCFCFLIGLLLLIRGFWKNAMMGDWDDLEIG